MFPVVFYSSSPATALTFCAVCRTPYAYVYVLQAGAVVLQYRGSVASTICEKHAVCSDYAVMQCVHILYVSLYVCIVVCVLSWCMLSRSERSERLTREIDRDLAPLEEAYASSLSDFYLYAHSTSPISIRILNPSRTRPACVRRLTPLTRVVRTPLASRVRCPRPRDCDCHTLHYHTHSISLALVQTRLAFQQK
jgi:hypothetical protein